MKIPYGISDFEQIRRRGFFYVDKTPFLPVLESEEAGYRHLIFLRPRRFGKSTLVSMLEHYYDIGRRDQFDELFRGLWIHEHPTEERSSYLVLTLDFSSVATDAGEGVLRRTFFQSVRAKVRAFLLKYRDRIPPLGGIYDAIDGFEDAEALMGEVLAAIASARHKLYLIIDEYDHFANRLLAGGAQDVYTSVITRMGFVRTFYATLKSGTTSGAVGRMFITGVSPFMLDDLSSGFNMATNVSLAPRLNALAGLTSADTERAVDGFLAARPELSHLFERRGALLDVLEEHYNGYRFSPKADECVFNAGIVLYFFAEVAKRGRLPEDMLDPNVRTEYRHLQRVGAASGAEAGERRALLSTILKDGHIRSDLVRQFGVTGLSTRAPFLSLLYYLGMLTLGTAPRDSIGYDLVIPNRVIRELQWEHLALMLRDEAAVTINVDDLQVALGAMAERGDIDPFLEVFHRHVIQSFSNRDARGLDEKTIKLLFMTYVSLGRAFYPLSEAELAQGYGDLFLGASREVAGARYSWLLEFKYLKAGAKPAQVEAAFAEAEAQVNRYASDQTLMPLLLRDRELKAGMLVFVGAKKVLYRPWPSPPKGGRARARS